MVLLQLPFLNKKIYYALSFTWGIIMTIIGCLATIALMACGKRPKRNQYGWYIMCGKGWGGFSAGPCSVVCEDYTEHILAHEFGHSIQNCFLGPFMIFLVVIPSVCRYWYRELKHITSPPYDSVWFEGTATALGEKYKKGRE